MTTRASVERRAPMLGLALAALLSGCQSSGAPKTEDKCAPTVGMTTAQLAECGCFSTSKQARYAITSVPDEPSAATQSISILNYFCPADDPGFVEVTVTNGIVTEVFR